MAERSYSEQRDSPSKFTRLLGFILLGFTILLVGVALVIFGITAESCSGGFLGFFQTCSPTINYPLLTVGIVFMVFSSPIFLLSSKAYKGREITIIFIEVNQAIMVTESD